MVGVKPFLPAHVYLSIENTRLKGGVSVRLLLGHSISYDSTFASTSPKLCFSSPEEAYQNYDAIIVGSVKQ